MTLATLATFFALSGLTASGVPIDWHEGNPRILAVSEAQRSHLGEEVCVTFPGGDRITYHALDICPACKSGQVDILVSSPEKARRLGRVELVVTTGACNAR